MRGTNQFVLAASAGGQWSPPVGGPFVAHSDQLSGALVRTLHADPSVLLPCSALAQRRRFRSISAICTVGAGELGRDKELLSLRPLRPVHHHLLIAASAGLCAAQPVGPGFHCTGPRKDPGSAPLGALTVCGRPMLAKVIETVSVSV
jgi:hypothetical protein